jgi:dolichol-phosphate mannosyltransferase
MIAAPKPVLMILSPVYNEEAVIPLFFARCRPVLEGLSARYDVRLTFLNNASTDGTIAQIREVRNEWPATRLITMSRNVGYQSSLQCGLRNTEADVYVIIDADCEDPPEMIPTFVARHEEGYDIAYGERVDRPEPLAVKSARKAFYRLLQRIADDDIILDMAEFSLFNREVRNAILEENTSFPFLRAAIGRVGFRRIGIPFTRQARIAGRSNYNMWGMSLFAIAGLLAASTLLLRLPVYVFPFWLIALAVLGWLLVATGSAWFALAAFLVFAAYLGAAASFTALYVARTYKNGLQRPNAFIDRRNSIL